MEKTARDFGLATDVRRVPDLGSWTANCAQKPAYIRDRMLDYDGRPIVWLDADARVRKRPALFVTLECDFAAHWRHGIELLSGTMFWGATQGAWRLVQAWVEAQRQTPDVWDQVVLARVLATKEMDGISVHRLPSTYTAVWDCPKMGNEKTWVISHHQASRRLATPSTR